MVDLLGRELVGSELRDELTRMETEIRKISLEVIMVIWVEMMRV